MARKNIPNKLEDRIIRKAYTILTNRLREATIHLPTNKEVEVFLKHKLMLEEREVFGAIWLTAKNRVIACEELALGTLLNARVYPREVVKSALKHNAANVILFHNHPAGDALPSPADKATTVVMMDALALVDVMLVDHFIVAATNAYSFSQMGDLKEIDRLRNKEMLKHESDLFQSWASEPDGDEKFTSDLTMA